MSPSSRSTLTRLRYIAATIVGVGLVLVLVYAVVGRPEQEDPVDPGICAGIVPSIALTDTGECIGIIERSDLLDEPIRGVVGKILGMNEAVAKSPEPYVKIVLLTPLSLSRTSDSAMPMDQIQYSLEGAFTALYRANNDVEFGDPAAVKVQMLLANHGSRQEHSDRLIQDILARSEPDHPVVAVVGLGSSFTGTEQTAKALAGKGIPMVSAVASANSLNAQDIPGLHSVSPSNNDYALALRP